MKELYDMVNTVTFHTRESSVSRVRPGFEPFPKLTSRESNMSIKEEVQEIIDNVLVYDVDDAGITYLDPNASFRRHFRCWLDGSWPNGLPLPASMETLEVRNRRELREIVFDDVQFIPPLHRNSFTTHEGAHVTASEISADDAGGSYAPHGSSDWMERERWLRGITRRLRAWVINEFTGFLSYETNASRGTVRRHIVECTTEDGLAQLTRELIDDALEMISDGITDDPSEAELEAFDSLREDISRAFTDRYVPEPLGYLATSHWRKA